MRSRGDDELRHVGRGGSLNSNDVLADREQVIDVTGGCLCEDYWNCRAVLIRGAHLRICWRQLHVDVVSVSGRALVVVVTVGVALVNVQHGRLGIETEERRTEGKCHQPHRHRFYMKARGVLVAHKRQAYCSLISNWFESSCQRSSNERTLWL